jgi:hypothetical protein
MYALHTVSFLAGNWASPAATHVRYVGLSTSAPNAMLGNYIVKAPVGGVVRAAYVTAKAGTVGTAEAWTCALMVVSTAYTIQSLESTDDPRVWSNANLAAPVHKGDALCLRFTCPATWATPAANVEVSGIIAIRSLVRGT